MAIKVGLVGLGMAVTPHAKSLLDLKGRAEVALRLQPERRTAREVRLAFQVHPLRPAGDHPRGPQRAGGRRALAAEHAPRPGGELRAGRQARAAREAARDHDAARGEAGGGLPAGRRGAGGHAAEPAQAGHAAPRPRRRRRRAWPDRRRVSLRPRVAAAELLRRARPRHAGARRRRRPPHSGHSHARRAARAGRRAGRGEELHARPRRCTAWKPRTWCAPR